MKLKEKGLITYSCSKEKNGVLFINAVLNRLKDEMFIEDLYMYSTGSLEGSIAYYILYTGSGKIEVNNLYKNEGVLQSLVNTLKLDYNLSLSKQDMLNGYFNINDIIHGGDLGIVELDLGTNNFKCQLSTGETTSKSLKIDFDSINNFTIEGVDHLLSMSDETNVSELVGELTNAEGELTDKERQTLKKLIDLRAVLQLGVLDNSDYKVVLNKVREHFTV